MVTNPVNQGSKRYTMKQTFDVWYANRDTILFDISVGMHSGENYKIARPHQLFHLDMNQLNEQRQQQQLQNNQQLRQTIGLEHLKMLEALGNAASVPIAEDLLRVMQDFQSLNVGNGNGIRNGAEGIGSAHEKPLLEPPNLPKPSTAFPRVANHLADGEHLVQPENIHWIYLDASGNEQGPFAGDVMQEWLGDGYLTPDLQIRRQEQHSFQTLRLFCESINNFILPFKTPLPPTGMDSQAATALKDVAKVPGSGSQGTFGAHVSTINHDSVSAQGTGVSLASSSLFGTTPGPSSQLQLQSAFGSSLYPQIMPSQSFGTSGLRALSSNLTFDYSGSKDYSLMTPLFSTGPQFCMDTLNQNIGTGFGKLHMPSLLHLQIHGQQPVLSRSNSGWAIDTTLPNQMPQAPALGASAPLTISQQGLGGASLSQPSPISPWINRVSTSRAASPFIPTTSLNNEDAVLNELHSSMVTGILNDEEPALSYFQDRDAPVVDESRATRTKKLANSNSVLGTESVLNRVSKASQLVQTHVRVQDIPSVKDEVSSQKPEEKKSFVDSRRARSEAATDTVPEVVPMPVRVVTETASAPPLATILAPWAKKAPEADVPAVSLKEVQRIETECLEREKQNKAELKREIALATTIAASQADEQAALTAEKVLSFNWAVSSQGAVAKKTLAEIQKEEEEAAKSRALKKCNSGGSTVKNLLASTLASSVPKEDLGGAWTSVTKNPVIKKAALLTTAPTVNYSMTSGAMNPQALRSTSSQEVLFTSVNATVLKEDFLVWARSAMTNLYPSVSKDDLLEVFTTLPLHGDSQQLISETIYSSSATMDGRRFAQEFLKRRTLVERQIGSNAVGSWSSAIALSADKTPVVVDDDGWSTSVKSKKKGRKN